MTFEEIRDRFGAKRSGSGFMAKCPAHEDRSPSLSIGQGKDGNVILKCHAGCETRDVLGAMGLSFNDLILENGASSKAAEKIIDTYPYVDENGSLLSQVCRYEPKNFRQRRPDGKGGWSWQLNGVRRVLFNLPAVLRAEHVAVVEGEKDVLKATKFGLTATCNPGGAGKWKDEFSDFLRGKHVTIIPDSDEPGRRHADQVAQSLSGKAASVAICHLPEPVKDLSEWPLSVDSLLALIKKAPAWTPGSAAESLFDDFSEYENAPPLEFAIESFMQKHSVTAIAGLSGNAKTWIALSIIRSLLLGPAKLWGLFNVPSRAERVIYLIPESAIGPFKHRLQLMGLFDEVRSGRLLTRTLSKGPAPSLQDPRLLAAARDADIVCDTGIRFMASMESENSANEAAKGLSEDLFALQRAQARTITVLFHSPKSVSTQNVMTLENMIRGSGEFGAALATAWGIKQIDRITNTVHVENLKARDFEACGPFQIIGRPYIDETGDFALHKSPNECGNLADEQPEMNSGNAKKREGRAANIELVRRWIDEDPEPSTAEMRKRFEKLGISVDETTVRGYKSAARKA